MLLERNPELEKPAKRSKTLIVSVLIHVVLLAIVILDPGLFDSAFKRVIRIEGNDYDQPLQLTELELQPPPQIEPKPVKPLTEPPPVVEPKSPPPEAAPPPPPPPPPTPPPPPHVIRPDDVIAPGARPDGQTQASRGSTPEPQRQGGGSGDGGTQSGRNTPQQGPPQQRGDTNTPPAPATPQVAQNTNPKAMTLPNLAKAADRIADQQIRAQERGGATGGLSGATMGPKSGRSDAPNGQNFSADGNYKIRSDPKGYDFGSYMNGVLNKVRNNWLIPDSARFGRRGRVEVEFTILKSGDIADCRIVGESGDRALDGAAKSAIDASNPFQKLPSGFSGNDLQLTFFFFYNIPIE